MKETKILYVGRVLAADLQDCCNHPHPDLCATRGLSKDEPLFDKEVEFPNGCRVVIQVCQPVNNAEEPCWTQGVLYAKEGTELACTEVGESFLGEYYLAHGDLTFVVEVRELDVSGPLTTHEEADYLEGRGQYCPKCRSEHIEAAHLDADGPIARSNAECHDCGYRWVDLYELCGINPAEETV